MSQEKAIFAGGCFWGVEKDFLNTPGVIDTRVGYIGGVPENPTYEQVCSHSTGHAEAVEVIYDPSETSFELLLDVFFSIHDPTQVDRQGPDVGDQYRSAIFPQNDKQKELSIHKIEALTKEEKFNQPIATKIESDSPFYAAEDYHQKYFQKNQS